MILAGWDSFSPQRDTTVEGVGQGDTIEGTHSCPGNPHKCIHYRGGGNPEHNNDNNLKDTSHKKSTN